MNTPDLDITMTVIQQRGGKELGSFDIKFEELLKKPNLRTTKNLEKGGELEFCVTLCGIEKGRSISNEQIAKLKKIQSSIPVRAVQDNKKKKFHWYNRSQQVILEKVDDPNYRSRSPSPISEKDLLTEPTKTGPTTPDRAQSSKSTNRRSSSKKKAKKTGKEHNQSTISGRTSLDVSSPRKHSSRRGSRRRRSKSTNSMTHSKTDEASSIISSNNANHKAKQKIRLTAHSGRGFKLRSRKFRKDDIPDVYLKIQVGDEDVWKTSVVKNDMTPAWYEAKIFFVEDCSKVIRVEVWDHNKGKLDPDTFYGSFEVLVSKFLMAGECLDMEIIDEDGDNTGMFITMQCDLEDFGFVNDILSRKSVW